MQKLLNLFNLLGRVGQSSTTPIMFVSHKPAMAKENNWTGLEPLESRMLLSSTLGGPVPIQADALSEPAINIEQQDVTTEADQYEQDDKLSQVAGNEEHVIATDGTPTFHSIHHSTDVDWISFRLDQAMNVVVKTNGDVFGDTILRLFKTDASGNNAVEIAIDDNNGLGDYSKIVLRGSAMLGRGTYWVKVAEKGQNDTIGNYRVRVISSHRAVAQAIPTLPDNAADVGLVAIQTSDALRAGILAEPTTIWESTKFRPRNGYSRVSKVQKSTHMASGVFNLRHDTIRLVFNTKKMDSYTNRLTFNIRVKMINSDHEYDIKTLAGADKTSLRKVGKTITATKAGRIGIKIPKSVFKKNSKNIIKIVADMSERAEYPNPFFTINLVELITRPHSGK